MKRKLTQNSLINLIKKRAFSTHDPRALNRHYEFGDVIMNCFWMCFLNASSVRSYYEDLSRAKGNLKALCKLSEIPCRNQMRNILDVADVDDLKGVLDDIVAKMGRSGILREFKHDRFGYLVAIDGTQVTNSEKIHCKNCSQKHHRDGRIEYNHSILNTMLIHPHRDVALPIGAESIQKQDGSLKEDCERNAAKRWLPDFSKRHKILSVTVLADALHCNQPFIEMLQSKGYRYIMACKKGSHKYLFEWVATLRHGNDLQTTIIRKNESKRERVYQYEYANGIAIREQEGIKTNFIKLTITDPVSNKVLKTFTYLTNYKISSNNVETLVEAGRRRWKVENEGHNTLKTKGYNFNKNYGHGKKNLCHLMAIMKLITLAIHTVLDYVQQEGFAKVRQVYTSTQKAMCSIRTLFWLKRCKSWEELYAYAIEGVDSS